MGSFRKRFLTPNSPVPGGIFVLKLIIPKDVQFIMNYLGALSDLAEEGNWEKFGEMLPEDAAEWWSKILKAYELSEEGDENMGQVPLGGVIPFFGAVVPENWHLCDGSTLLQADYAELTAVIDSTFLATVGGQDVIQLPDMARRTVIGEDTGTYDIGDIGGEETHQLEITEMPNHSHWQRGLYADNLFVHNNTAGTNPRLGTGGTTGGTQPLEVATTGSGFAHNNMQPYTVSRFIMRVK